MADTSAAEYGRRYWTLLYANHSVEALAGSVSVEIDGDGLAILRKAVKHPDGTVTDARTGKVIGKTRVAS